MVRVVEYTTFNYYGDRMSNKEEQQYLDILEELLTATPKGDRTGTGTNTLFCRSMRFDLSKSFPLLTTKKVFWKGVAVELLWFLKGDTNIRYLVQNGVHIWDDWPYEAYVKSFADPKSLMEVYGQYDMLDQKDFIQKIIDDEEFANKWGSIGDGGYGAQWRAFGALDDYKPYFNYNGDYVPERSIRNFVKGFDQIKWLINEIKTNPDSRRLLVWAFDPKAHNELNKAKLPPCHMGFQVVVLNGKLNLVWTQRSADTFLGTPFNIASYALLTHLLALECGLEVGELVYEGHDVHLYQNHVEQAKIQLSREPFPFPQIKINNRDSIFDYELTDFEIVDYQSWSAIKAPIAV